MRLRVDVSYSIEDRDLNVTKEMAGDDVDVATPPSSKVGISVSEISPAKIISVMLYLFLLGLQFVKFSELFFNEAGDRANDRLRASRYSVDTSPIWNGGSGWP